MASGSKIGYVATVAVLTATTAALAGPDWVEVGDAGSGVGSAQVPFGTATVLSTISGTLVGNGILPDFEDCYIIKIIDPANFSMQASGANFNPQLFLFNITLPGGGYGLLANDDQTAINLLPKLGPISTDGTNVQVTLPGDYMIAITGFNRDPVSTTGAIFNQSSLTEVSGPDGPGGFNALTGWSGTGQTGSYNITLTGAGMPTFPSPGAAGLLILGGLTMARRKR